MQTLVVIRQPICLRAGPVVWPCGSLSPGSGLLLSQPVLKEVTQLLRGKDLPLSWSHPHPGSSMPALHPGQALACGRRATSIYQEGALLPSGLGGLGRGFPGGAPPWAEPHPNRAEGSFLKDSHPCCTSHISFCYPSPLALSPAGNSSSAR